MFFRETFSLPRQPLEPSHNHRRYSHSSSSTGSTSTASSPPGRSTPLPARFHYLGDQPLEITSDLKGYNYTRQCSSSLYMMEDGSKETWKSYLSWRLLRWVLIPCLLLALLVSLSLYFLYANSNGEILVISEELEPQSTYFRPPVGGVLNNTNHGELDSGEVMDFSDPPNFLSDNSKEEDPTSGETFVDRLISSFQGSLGETGIKLQPGIKQLERNKSKEGTTQGLAVSPTLPSVPPPGHQPTKDPPLNHTESACRSPGITLCRGILPWDLTSLPSLPSGRSMPTLNTPIALRQALPYFEMVLQSGCSPRAKQFLCPLLEPQCQPYGSPITPPCRKTCRAVAEDCSDFILGTLDLSKVFQCDMYPDSSDPSICVDLTKGNSCLTGELKCEDSSCIPQRWKCDGHVDCPGGLDEINCIVCQNHEFMCGSRDKCVPLTYRCDGHTDCPDRSDEQDCHQPEYDKVMHSHASPCPSGELRCVDGRCISLSQICDGSKDCSDAADESNCRQAFRT